MLAVAVLFQFLEPVRIGDPLREMLQFMEQFVSDLCEDRLGLLRVGDQATGQTLISASGNNRDFTSHET